VNRGRVSVVIPTYNRAELLKLAVDSVLGQSHEDIELIVADDGSRDETLAMLASYEDSRLRVLPLAHTGILGRMNNAALQIATGEFVALLDSDDIWLPNKLERQLAVLRESPSVGLVCSNAYVMDEHGVDLGHRYLPADLGVSGMILEDLLDVNFIIRSSAVARRTVIERVGRFSEALELRTTDDYDMWLRVAALSEVYYLPEALLGYREHAGSVRVGFPRCTYWQALLISLDNLERLLDESDIDMRALVRRRRAEWMLRLGLAQRREIGTRIAAHSLLSALRSDPFVVPSVLRRATSRRVRRAVLRVRPVEETSHLTPK
jgi:glycosyltransferase involved in cell wall biosynthesis